MHAQGRSPGVEVATVNERVATGMARERVMESAVDAEQRLGPCGPAQRAGVVDADDTVVVLCRRGGPALCRRS